MFFEAVSLICIALLWGGTNPILKRNSKKIVEIKSSSVIVKFLLEIKYLATNIKFLVPLALNQLGSVLYFLTLQRADLSLCVPVANSLTFVFTAICGWVLGEELPRKGTILGIVLIIFGTVLCFYDKHVITLTNQ